MLCHVSLGVHSQNLWWIQKVQTKQSHAIRLILFARAFGEQTDSANKPFTTTHCVYCLLFTVRALRFTYLWQTNLLPNVFTIFSSMLVVDILIIYSRYAASQNHESEQTPGNNRLYPL